MKKDYTNIKLYVEPNKNKQATIEELFNIAYNVVKANPKVKREKKKKHN